MSDEIFDVARKTIYWGISMLIISIIVLAYVFIIVGYKERLTVYPPELIAELLSLRFTNAPECFAHQDPVTKQTILGTIDLSKFTIERLNKCYSTNQETGHREMNFHLQLASDPEKSVATNNYYNVDHFTLRRDVLVYNEGKVQKDELLIYVQDGISVRPQRSRVDAERMKPAVKAS